jgi:sulfur-oxidizing protein SoxY
MNDFTDAPDAARRLLLKGALASGLAGLGLAATGWPTFAATDAKDWPAKAFGVKGESEALKELFGKNAEPSDKITVDAPEIAENGAVVPVSVSSSLPNVTTIAILVLDNPNTLVAAYKIPEGTEASVANRLKMAQTSKVVAVIEAGGKLYSAAKEVKVTVGGCGG